MPGNLANDGAPLDDVIQGGANPLHYIVGAKASLPVDTAGNPWNGSWVYDHGNLAANLLNNVILESTGVLQKSRIYEMSDNKTLRETIAFFHQNAFAKALETLGVDWGKPFPIPNYDINKYPECRKLICSNGLPQRSI